MKIVKNADGSVTYIINHMNIEVQETVSKDTLNTLKNMPRTKYQKENWYEDKIFIRLMLEWNEMLRNTNNH